MTTKTTCLDNTTWYLIGGIKHDDEEKIYFETSYFHRYVCLVLKLTSMCISVFIDACSSTCGSDQKVKAIQFR